MTEDIVPLLHRRSDLSTFLIHLTRDAEGRGARGNMLSILYDRRIEARTAYGMAKMWADVEPAVAATQRCVCFTEAPLEQAWMITRDIAGRATPLSPYGLVFTKTFGRRRGVNPVWYIDITPGHNWLTNAVNAMVEISKRGRSHRIASQPPDVSGELVEAPSPAQDPILQITPFFEQMGPAGATKKEFWWEREWRYVGSFANWTWNDVVAVLAPEDEHAGIQADLAAAHGQQNDWVGSQLKFLDAGWGLERMIAALAGVNPHDAGPLPHY